MAVHSPAPVQEFDAAGCFFVLLGFTSNFLWGSVCKTLGLMLPTLRDQLDTGIWVLGTIVSVAVATIDITGLFVGVMEARIGSRALLVGSALIQALGLLAVPLVTTCFQMGALLTLFVATGMGITNVLNKVYVGRHFSRRYTLAAGLAQSGNSVAFLVAAPMVQLFLDTYGWRAAMLLFGAVCCHSVPVAAAVRVSSPRYAPVPAQPEESTIEESTTEESTIKECTIQECTIQECTIQECTIQECTIQESTIQECTIEESTIQESTIQEDATPRNLKALCLRLYTDLDLGIVLEFNFFVLVMCYIGRITTYTAWVIYYVPHLEAKGISPQTSAVLCSVAGVGFVIGTVLWAPFIDRGWLKSSTVLVVSNLVFSVALIADPWLDDVAGQAVITLVSGMGLSALCTVSEVLTRDLYPDRLTSAFGTLRFFCFMPRILIGFLSGWIYDSTGSYDVAFIVVGLLPTLTLIPLVIGRLLKRF